MRQGTRRVAITGIGALSCVGHGADGLWEGCARGPSGVGPVTRFDPGPFSCKIAGEIRDFDPSAWMDEKIAKRLDRFAQFSLATARMALTDSGLDLDSVDREKVGIYIGSALGGIAFAEEQHAAFLAHGIKAVRPTLAISVFGGASSCNIAMEFGTFGPNVANANSCASGAIAVGEAARLVARGEVRAMLAGGVECPLSQLAFGAFSMIRAMSTRNDDPSTASRPFDRDRDGFVMAEGAGILVLEEMEAARRRGARIYAEVLGYGTTNDAYSMTSPRPDALQSSRCMRLALEDAACAPEEIGYISAHGSSTVQNDSGEAAAIRIAMGSHRPPVSSTKSAHGHALGAAGAMELALCAQTFSRNELPPNRNLFHKAEDCDLDIVENVPRSASVRRVLSNSFGFGGINACVVLGAV
ncbi:MAG TPA: beta-ketoacyl-ACP synthase II [Fibrobacteria bacterium]|nr:beta-ketoacyl-ACP synthase II [Fibrobacteria bacterium]